MVFFTWVRILIANLKKDPITNRLFPIRLAEAQQDSAKKTIEFENKKKSARSPVRGACFFFAAAGKNHAVMENLRQK